MISLANLFSRQGLMVPNCLMVFFFVNARNTNTSNVGLAYTYVIIEKTRRIIIQCLCHECVLRY